MVGTGMLWFFGSLIRRFLVLDFLVGWFFLFCWIRAEGFPGVYVGLLGFFFSFFSGMQGFSLFLFFVGPLVFSLFFSCSGGSGVLSHGAGLDLFSMITCALGLQIHYDLAHYIFPCVLWTRRWRYIACSR